MNEWKAQARWLVSRAVLAPSSHNTQPWIFRISESAIVLYADRRRALPANDPDDRELAISCGCALMNLRIAATSKGLDAHVLLLPEPEEADRLARVSFSGQSNASPEDTQLAGFIEARRTCRKRFAPRPVTASVLDQLTDAARREGARLKPLTTENARRQAAALVAEGDAAQWASPGWRRELADWMHPGRRGDGLAVPVLAAPVIRAVVRSIDMGGSVGAKDRQLAEASPLLAVLGTDSDEPRGWLLAGQALQRILLVACQHGLQASYLNQPVQVAALRPRLRDLAGDGYPQVLLRMGYPVDEIPPAPRRAIEDVIELASAC